MLAPNAVLPSQFDRCQTPETIILNHEQDPLERANLRKAMDLETASGGISFRFEKNICTSYNIGIEIVPGNKQDANTTPQPAVQVNPTTGETELKTRSSVKAVLFGSRKRDGREVVIKMRSKAKSFKDSQEIYEWLGNMRLLFHIAGGPAIIEDPTKEKQACHPHIANVLDIIEDNVRFSPAYCECSGHH